MPAVAVFDVGKTNSKVAAVDLASESEIRLFSVNSPVVETGPYPHIDTEKLWTFLLDSLRRIAAETAIDAISVAAHGSAAALVDRRGELVLPVLDYEFDGPDTAADAYAAARPPYSVTGSPHWPAGLNLGKQLYWLSREFPSRFSRTRHILTWPQYWTMRLTGVAASEVTSLGAGTDLWEPGGRRFSEIVDRQDWRRLLPPLRKAHSVLGPIRRELADTTGLRPDTAVLGGVHDTNAALYPHLKSRNSPFSVVSTGTWVIALAVGGRGPVLDENRGVVLNVDVNGNPVPSVQFMGGREFSRLTAGAVVETEERDSAAVLQRGMKFLPTLVAGSGPFPHGQPAWINAEGASTEQKQVAASYYLAMVTAASLDLIGAEGDVIVEGPMSRNQDYLDLLAASTGRQIVTSGGAGGTRHGAALLAGADFHRAADAGDRVHTLAERRFPALNAYAGNWRASVSAAG